MITFLQLKENLKQAEYPALCFFGKDRWLQRKALATLCDVYQIADDGFGVERLDNPTYNQIESACATFSMFCAKKLVVCENLQLPQGKNLQTFLDKMSLLVSHCDGSFCLVIISETSAGWDKIGGMQMVNCERLGTADVVRWIVAYGRRQGVAIDNLCARKICEYCLQDMSRVASETQKLIDFGTVTSESVELLVHKDVEYLVFDLSRAIAAKNAKLALEMYRSLISGGEEARGLFGLLYNTYRRAYYVKTSDLPLENLATLLGVKPFAVEKAKELAEKYKPMQLKRILDYFEQADVRIKTFADENDVMTTLIMKIVSV